jgi:hypothetical protein
VQKQKKNNSGYTPPQPGQTIRGETKEIFTDFLKDMKSHFEDTITHFILKVLGACGIHTENDIQIMMGTHTPISVNDVISKFQNNVLNNNQLKNELIEELQNGAIAAFKNSIRRTGLPLYRVIPDDKWAREFCNSIFGRWTELDPQAREFYRKHVGLLQRSANTIVYGPKPTSGSVPGNTWTNRLMDDHFMAKFSQNQLQNCDRDDMRINLMKETATSEQVLFSATLPFIPTNSVGKLWYSSDVNRREFIENKDLSVDVLKKNI